MGNMRFKVSDRVRIKSIDWYRKYANKNGIIVCGNYYFTQNMSKYCGKVLMITNVIRDFYICKDVNYQFTDEMIEGLVEKETYEFLKTDKPNRPSLNDFMDILDNKIKLPEGYVFKDENGNVINATKIVLEKKKEYPKTFEECVHVLEGENRMSLEQMNTFRKLIDARNAYWKIAGWEPDWTNLECDKFCIWVDVGDITLRDALRCQHILAFPTEEMRDAFYENFKVEIESCKELL